MEIPLHTYHCTCTVRLVEVYKNSTLSSKDGKTRLKPCLYFIYDLKKLFKKFNKINSITMEFLEVKS